MISSVYVARPLLETVPLESDVVVALRRHDEAVATSHLTTRACAFL